MVAEFVVAMITAQVQNCVACCIFHVIGCIYPMHGTQHKSTHKVCGGLGKKTDSLYYSIYNVYYSRYNFKIAVKLIQFALTE